ncbi:hypothetical protein [Pseudonocardia kunmingensis]|uniref:hypothetical protein n=1 Tax=Pseudonocardia kunmingensis TaxID=630975 RepID=UPI00114D9334|nr:hypothetical protein [Pseudonocardia kunmingensis]
MPVPDDLMTAFASLDRARLTRMSESARVQQLDARQALLDYTEALWQDVRRAGERPAVGEKYQALATVREVARALTAVAFDAVYDRPPS